MIYTVENLAFFFFIEKYVSRTLVNEVLADVEEGVSFFLENHIITQIIEKIEEKATRNMRDIHKKVGVLHKNKTRMLKTFLKNNTLLLSVLYICFFSHQKRVDRGGEIIKLKREEGNFSSRIAHFLTNTPCQIHST